MMHRLIKWVTRLGAALVLIVAGLLSPIAYVEIACSSDVGSDDYDAILPAQYHRPESRTLLTYPEWHIVHAYDDYARVISKNDPHEFAYLSSIGGFWSSTCALSTASGDHGGFPWATKQLVYTIGVSFTAELLAKAAYEETLGRIAVLVRGDEHAPLDTLSATQAAEYAVFLQQTPWYKWDFPSAAKSLSDSAGVSLRDSERNFALGVENAVKASYARVIAAAVASVGQDELTLRMIVWGVSETQLNSLKDVTVIGARPAGYEIETPRYRQLTLLLAEMARLGGEFVEIAGNDDILFTTLSEEPNEEHTIYSFARQGYGDWRNLNMVKVSQLAASLRSLDGAKLRLEHVHDY